MIHTKMGKETIVGTRNDLMMFNTSKIDSLENSAQPFMLTNNANGLSWHRVLYTYTNIKNAEII